MTALLFRSDEGGPHHFRHKEGPSKKASQEKSVHEVPSPHTCQDRLATMGPNRTSIFLSLRQGAAGHRACAEWLEEPLHGTRRTPLEFQARSFLSPSACDCHYCKGQEATPSWGSARKDSTPPPYTHTQTYIRACRARPLAESVPKQGLPRLPEQRPWCP